MSHNTLRLNLSHNTLHLNLSHNKLRLNLSHNTLHLNLSHNTLQINRYSKGRWPRQVMRYSDLLPSDRRESKMF